MTSDRHNHSDTKQANCQIKYRLVHFYRAGVSSLFASVMGRECGEPVLMTMVIASFALRPTRSPKWPKMVALKGRARKPTA